MAENTIGYILDFLKFIPNKKFHLVFSSHSPFILSDLLKENVIFLENGIQVYPFEDGKQTFGANIHTLLSHGFFMSDGLMGEFAKSKITKILRFLNNDNKIYRDWETDRKSTRLNSSHRSLSRMPSSA